MYLRDGLTEKAKNQANDIEDRAREWDRECEEIFLHFSIKRLDRQERIFCF